MKDPPRFREIAPRFRPQDGDMNLTSRFLRLTAEQPENRDPLDRGSAAYPEQIGFNSSPRCQEGGISKDARSMNLSSSKFGRHRPAVYFS